MSKESSLKSHCFGTSLKLLGSLLYAQGPCRDSSLREPSRWCVLDVENTCLNRPFWTGLRAKQDIIQGAWGRRVLQQERSHVSL